MEEKSGAGNSPTISLPKGGGAIQGIGETFSPYLFTGTANFSVPIFTSPCRSEFSPQLSLQYSSGKGNGIFGMGWNLSIPAISRKTAKGLPLYRKGDVFLISGSEDLMPKYSDPASQKIDRKVVAPAGTGSSRFQITRYLPRTEGLFARIESWEELANDDSVLNHFWRVTTKENVTSIYGRTAGARIADSKNPQRICEWLLEETFDAKGNHILYEYAADDPALQLIQRSEQNREYNQRYPRRIFYGNVPSQLTDFNGNNFTAGPTRQGTDHRDPFKRIQRNYVFEIVFDYGDWQLPQNNAGVFSYQPPAGPEVFGAAIPVRPDPFSSYRAGFERRTLRRCRHVLMIHHFSELGGACLIKSTDFHYREAAQTGLSFLQLVTLTGYAKPAGGSKYVFESMPPVEFKYTEFQPGKQRYHSVSAESNELPPHSLHDVNTTMVDMFGNGLPDIVQSSAGGFRYWRNLGEGRLDRPKILNEAPVGITLEQAGVSFGDLGGDGLSDLIVHNGAVNGFFEMQPEREVNGKLEGGWSPASFKHYENQPGFALADPNLRMLDLTGDGLTDLLITREDHFIWYQGRGEAGFEQRGATPKTASLRDIYFSDPSGRVRLADLTGDSLNDIVLIHNGRIDYWPSLGYGNFGPRVTMENAPHFPPNFDPKRLFLADLDGSGTADLVYVDFCEVHYWLNGCGNGWSEKFTIKGTPVTTDTTSLSFLDFFGTGTTCLLWSYDFGTFPGSNYKVLDFCGGLKPNLLIEMDNNLGAATRVRYASSTKFYLEDLKARRFWATPLPFPVHVVEKTETIDHVGKTKLVSRYKYHHGYYDGHEREFRGFGRVDKIDTEFFEDFGIRDLHGDAVFTNAEKSYHVPPVEVRTWFNTGAYFENNDILARYRSEYLAGVNNLPSVERPVDNEAFIIADHDLPSNIDELAGAHRALRGSLLRREVYAHDNGSEQDFPYTVEEHFYRVERKQAKGETPETRQTNPYPVFLTTQRESLSYHYERRHISRNLLDPRIKHELTLDVDAFGNVLHSASVSYQRRQATHPEQSKDAVTITETEYIDALDTTTDFLHSTAAGSKIFELTGQPRIDGRPHVAADLLAAFNQASNLAFEETPVADQPQKRLLKQQATLFWNDNLTDSLPYRSIAFHGLTYESYQLALTPALRQNIYGNRITAAMGIEAGYRQKQGEKWQPAGSGDWWIPSGVHTFDAAQFYIGTESADAFGNKSVVIYDPYRIFPVRVTDDLGNIIEGLMDYRVLQPFWARDINGNHSEAAFDVLGRLTGTALMGKAGADPARTILGLNDAALNQMRTNSQADSLADFETDLIDFDAADAARYTKILDCLDDPDGAGNPVYSTNRGRTMLGKATTRLLYDVHRYRLEQKPAAICTITRELHENDATGQAKALQVSYSYSDGFGRQVQTKAQGEAVTDPATGEKKRRWIGTGWAVFNNKGKPVEKYEPFLSDIQGFEFERKEGKSLTYFYDSVGRVVCTVQPNGTYQKVLFDPWRLLSWDANDTVLLSPVTDPDVKGFVESYFENQSNFATWFRQRITDPANPPSPGNKTAQQEAALKTAKHANTPKVTHLDTQGNAFLAIFDNKTESLETRIEYDVEGNDLRVFDARKLEVFTHQFDMTKRRLFIDSKDAGLKIVLPAVDGNLAYDWDANGNRVHTIYDELRRTSEKRVAKSGAQEYLTEKIIYGESHPQATTRNLRGTVWKSYDGAGLACNELFDFKGNVLEAFRRLLQNGTAVEFNWPIDSSGLFDETAATAFLDSISYRTKNQFDTLGRPILKELPDGTKLRLTYNPAGFLKSLDGQKSDGTAVQFVTNIDYNTRGQRVAVEYGNGVKTEYRYEPETFRLTEISTTRDSPSPKQLQKLTYTYDAVGNITQIRDDAHSAVFNHNHLIEPVCGFTYDAVYRLIEASGREHEAMTACHYQSGSFKRTEFLAYPQPVSNSQALVTYTERYKYDESGNINRIDHVNSQRTTVRHQTYSSSNNRLLTSSAGCTGEGSAIPHDNNGNITKLAHLPQLVWDFKNQLVRVQLNEGATPNRAFYQYDSAGQRIRKTVVKNNGTLIEERIYLGDYEIYTERTQAGVQKRRDSLHVMDDQKRIVLIDQEKDPASPGIVLSETVRFQLDNHLGSAVMELDGSANIISYEEYYPFGSTAYLFGRNQAETSLKRYRYSAKERDDETGLYYYGVRYYAPWMARWTSSDPAGPRDGNNLYLFSANNPIVFFDPNGENSQPITVSHLRLMDEVLQIHMESDKQAHEELSRFRGSKDYASRVGVRAHQLTQARLKDRYGSNVDVEVQWRSDSGRGTDLDIVFRRQRLQIELKAATATVEKSGEQQMKQISVAARKGYSYGLVVARARGEGGGQHYYLNAKDTKTAATRAGVRNIMWNQIQAGNSKNGIKGFATPGAMGGMMLVSGALMVLSGLGEIKGYYDAAQTIDEVKAMTAPLKAKAEIKEINLNRISKRSGLDMDLHFVSSGDFETNMIIDANSGRLFSVVTEDDDDLNLRAGDIVQVGHALRIEDLPIFKDSATGDVYARTNGWQIMGPSMGLDVNYFPQHRVSYPCFCYR